MIAVSNRLQVAKGQEKEFEARFEGRARLVENMPGFVRLEILRPLKSDYYIVLTHWKDEASFHAWTESAEFKEAHRNRPRAEIFSGPNVFEMHEVIDNFFAAFAAFAPLREIFPSFGCGSAALGLEVISYSKL